MAQGCLQILNCVLPAREKAHLGKAENKQYSKVVGHDFPLLKNATAA